MTNAEITDLIEQLNQSKLSLVIEGIKTISVSYSGYSVTINVDGDEFDSVVTELVNRIDLKIASLTEKITNE